MVEFLEQLLHDTLWEWLENQNRYENIGSEITLGEGGRIDILAKTTDGLQVGFEVKADVEYRQGQADGFDLSKQLSRYISTGYLDELYYVSPDVSVFEGLKEYKTNRLIKRELYMGFGWYLYEVGFKEYSSTHHEPELPVDLFGAPEGPEDWQSKLQHVRKELESALPDRFISEFDMDGFMSMVEKHSTDGPDSRNFDYDVLNFDEIVEELLDQGVVVPNRVGTIEIPFEVLEPEETNYRMDLNEDPEQMFTNSPKLDVNMKRSAEKLDRVRDINLPSDNEAWVQHHCWREMGNIREGVIPIGEGNTRFIDVMGFKGGIHPTEIIQTGGEIIGIEAKDGNLPESRHEKIVEQLLAYEGSGTVSRLYLAVPLSAEAQAKDILRNGPQTLSNIGLITVDRNGQTQIQTVASELELKYDGYRTSQGNLRAVGYGRLKIRESNKFVSVLDAN